MVARFENVEVHDFATVWDATCSDYTGNYTEEDLAPVMKHLKRLLVHESDKMNHNKLSAVKRKFATYKQLHVSPVVTAMSDCIYYACATGLVLGLYAI